MTTLDIYATISIIILVVLCIWHSIIATIIFLNPTLTKIVEPTNPYVILDRYVFIGLFITYFIIHIALTIWLIYVPYKRRREMTYLDREYAANKHIQFDTRQSRYEPKNELIFRRSSVIAGDNSPSIKPLRNMRRSEGVLIIPNATSFVPIQEERNARTTKSMNMIELREQDDKYPNHDHELKSTQMTPIEKP